MGNQQIKRADVALKEFWRQNDRFADLFNSTVFDGELLLKAEDLQELDTDVSGYISADDASYASADNYTSADKHHKKFKKSLQRNRDIIKKSAFGIEFAILAIENQKEIHYAMPLRTMLYDGLTYQKELQELTRKRKQEKSLHTSEEYLSGMKKEDRLHPVITLVISYSEDIWDGPLCLKDMIIEIPEKIERIFSDYKMNLIQIRKSDQYNFQNEDVKTLFEVTRYIYEREFSKMKKEYKDKKISSEMLQVLGSVTGSKELTELGEQETEVTGTKMCRALEEWREEGVQMGYETGTKQILQLTSLLFQAGRADDIIRASSDEAYLQKLKDEFHIS